MMDGKGKTISLLVPIDLLARIEAAAGACYCSRSDYIRLAIVLRLDQQQITIVPGELSQDPDLEQSEEEFLKELAARYSQGKG